MFNFLRKSKESKLDEFYKAVYADAFPKGDEQIQEEVILLKGMMENEYTDDFLKSVLLQATVHLYYSTLENTPFTGGEMMKYLTEKHALPSADTATITKHVFEKIKVQRIS